MKGIFIPGITAEMFRNGCLESVEALMAVGKIYDVEIPIIEGEKVDNAEENVGKTDSLAEVKNLAPDATMKMTKKKDFYKLAQLIKLAAKDVSKEAAWWKVEDVAVMLGFEKTDDEPDVLEVTDDSGYRSIIIGDVRGHHGYVYLYSENEEYSHRGDVRKWQYRCFPPTKDISTMLEKLYNAEYCPDIFSYYKGDDENISSCVTYLSEVVKKYVDKIASDKRSALEIFESCQ